MERPKFRGNNAATIVNEGFKQGVNPETWGVWAIHGEDSNCDMGGPHEEPLLEHFEGTLRQAALRAVTLPRFTAWGGGGYVERTSVPPRGKKVETSDPLRAASERLTAARREVEEAEKVHAAAIRSAECRLGCMKKLEPVLKTLSNDEMNVAKEIFAGLVDHYTA